jgi:hypothetical protein
MQFGRAYAGAFIKAGTAKKVVPTFAPTLIERC